MMKSGTKPTLSVIMPALNEEANIAAAVQETIKALGDRFSDYELLLFDDGSRDQTGSIMDQLAISNPHLHVTHNPTSRNIGGVYKQGIDMARFEYVLLVPGDNEVPAHALTKVLDALDTADMILPFWTNPEIRSWGRRIASRAYTVVLNLLFGQHLKYYNGTVIHRTDNLRSITINTDSFAYQSEVLIKLIRAGKSYVEIGVSIQPRAGGRSNAVRWRNLMNVFRAVLYLVREIHFSESDSKGVGVHELSGENQKS